jgi:adenylate cyclase
MLDLVHHSDIRAQQREVTLLFADLRGVTELAAALEMDPLFCELLAHVMDCLTDAVLEHQGHIVDYYGDGLMAMWNAPADQPEHSELACRAALAMLETLPSIADDWVGAIQSELRLGIGLHTGDVQVGNSGSKRRTKFGPRGPNVHVARRVEAATKELRQPLLATSATVERLSDRWTANRICRAQLPGLRQAVDLYAISCVTGGSHHSAAWRFYAQALRHFEEGRMSDAAAVLESIDTRIAHVPWRFLSSEVERELGRQQRRRSTDRPISSAPGVITLQTK